MCNFGRVHHEEQFCEVIFEFGQVVQEMSFKDISYLELWWPLCSGEHNHLHNFGRVHHEEPFCKIVLNLDQWFRRKCCLKIFSYLELWQPFCSAEHYHLCNLPGGYYEEQFCETNLNLGQGFRRCRLKDVLSRALVALLLSGG